LRVSTTSSEPENPRQAKLYFKNELLEGWKSSPSTLLSDGIYGIEAPEHDCLPGCGDAEVPVEVRTPPWGNAERRTAVGVWQWSRGGGRGDSRAVLAAEVLLGELHLELLAPQRGLAGAGGPSHDLGLQNLQL